MKRSILTLSLFILGCTRAPIVSSDAGETGTTGGSEGLATSVGTSPTTAGTTPTTAGTTPTTGPGPTSDTGFDESDVSGLDFIGNNDLPSTIECDPFEQNCRPGEKCMPWANDGGNAWNALKCVPVDPNPVDVGEECTVEGSAVSGIDNCDFGSMCWYVDLDTNLGECVPFCQGDVANPTCEDPNRICPLTGDGVLAICVATCNPLNAECGQDRVCAPFAGNFLCVPATLDAQYGDGCEFINGCADGLFCTATEDVPGCVDNNSCCAPFCDTTADPATECPDYPAHDCLPWYDQGQAPEGLENIGACLIPPP